MNANHKELISIGLTLGIIIFALFIIRDFLTPITWAAIISIVTYPLYIRWQKLSGFSANLAALSFTTILLLIFLLPLSWLITILVTETQIFINYLQTINRNGGNPPNFLQHFPIVGNELITYWNNNISQPGNIKNLLTNLHLSLTPASYYIKQIGFNLMHRSFQLGFTVLTLFFFYRDGQKLFQQINQIGEYCLGNRWFKYAEKLPSALRGTVSGTILVGLGVGLLLGLCYFFVEFPAPTLTGFITALAAMIPFVAPVIFTIIALILLATGKMIGALVVIIWGSLILFIADHFIKPALIGGTIELPFLIVLFGILGGVRTLGLLGLFVGPIIMVLFVTLWQESRTTKPIKSE